jgi:hypothetical protein
MSKKYVNPFQIIIVTLIAILFWIPTQSQDEVQSPLFHICIAPGTADARVGETYLITFRNTNLVGLVISEPAADIIVYSSDAFAAGTFPIVHDTATGIYRRSTESERHNSKAALNSERLCSANYPEIITDDLLGIEPLAVTSEQVAIIELGNANRMGTQDFLGGFALHFFSDNELHQKDFQIIQMDQEAAVMEMSFPFLTENTTRFALTANKPVFVRRSFADDNTTFSASCPSDIRLIYRKVLQGEEFDLFQMMENGQFRIYPFRGLVTDYPRGGFLQINLEPEAELRTPEFTEGSTIHSITDDVNFDYALPNNPNQRAGGLDRAQVVRIDENGRLIVHADGSNTEVIVMRPWLVEVVPN